MSITVFTALASNYLPKARVLYQSFKAQHPEIHFAMVLVDKGNTKGIPNKLIDSSADEVIGMKELLNEMVPNIEAWAFSHNLMELCTAVKAAAFQYFFANGATRVVFLDPDVWVLDSLEPIFDKLQKHSILLTPHFIKPETLDENISFIECGALKHGIFNLGFLGVKKDSNGCKFLKWWNERLLGWCYIDSSRGLFTDQKWINLAPIFFEGVHILRDPGINTARWNMCSHTVTGSKHNGFFIGKHRIRFFHFSGIESGQHDMMLEKFGKGNINLRKLTELYKEAISAEGSEKFSRYVPSLDLYSNGERCTNEQRILYAKRKDLQKAFPHPLRVTFDEPCFLFWYKEDLRRHLIRQVALNQDGNRLPELLSVIK